MKMKPIEVGSTVRTTAGVQMWQDYHKVYVPRGSIARVCWVGGPEILSYLRKPPPRCVMLDFAADPRRKRKYRYGLLRAAAKHLRVIGGLMDDIREKEDWKIGDQIRCTKCRSVVRYCGLGIANIGEGFCVESCQDYDGLRAAEMEAERAGSSRAITLHYWSRFRKLKIVDMDTPRKAQKD